MILVTGTNDRLITDVRRRLLRVGLISEKTTLSALYTHLRENPKVFAVLHIIEKRRPALLSVTELVSKQCAPVVQGVLLTDECPPDAVLPDKFDFVLPLSSKDKILCERIVFYAIFRIGIDPSEQIVGSIRYRLMEKEFLILLKRFSFTETHTAMLVALMEAYPDGLSRDELLKVAFLPYGRRSRSNVSHAVEAFNRRFFEAGLTGRCAPLICFTREKGYFLRS